ncbi:S8 family serine peptidase [Chryseobacterium sp. A301]
MKNKASLLMLSTALLVGCTTEREEQNPMPLDASSSAKVLDAPTGNVVDNSSRPIAGQYIVVLHDGVLNKSGISFAKSKNEKRANYLQKTGELTASMKKSNGLKLGIDNGKITTSFGYALEGFVAKNLTDAEVQSLRNDPRVKSVEQDYLIALGKPTKPGGGETTPTGQETPWGITRIGGFGDGTGKTAWVIDSGIDLDHPDLNVDTNRSVSFTGDNDPNDGNGHGTHVAGTIAALNNNIGVVGVAAGANVVALKVLGNDGSGSFSWTVQALDFVAASGSAGDVINMSLGPNSRYTDNAVDNATVNVASKGIKVAIAAGNSYDDANYYSPARATHANIYTISASTPNDYWAYFSNYGTVVDYAAPGYNIKSTWLNGSYNTISGTSMASPHAAGMLLLGTPKAGGAVKSAYWEYTKKGGGTLTGNYSGTNTYSLSIYRGDQDGKIDQIMVR